MIQTQGTVAQGPAAARQARGSAEVPVTDLPEDPLARGARLPRIAGTPALLLLASLVVSMLAGSSAPTPLYGIYQQQWGFTPITTTVVFAVYAVAVLIALLVAGRLSDYAGRRPVLLAALAVQVVALLVYARADGVGVLMAARVIQGLSTGVAFGTIGAALLDVSRERGALANALAAGPGTGGGALLSALFVQFLPAPTRLIYLVLAGVVVLQAVGVALLRETVTRRRIPASALVPEVRLPAATRGPVLAAAPVLLAVWAMFGLYGALGPSLVHALTGSSSVVLGGAALATLGAGVVVSVYLLRNTPARVVMVAGIGALAGGVAITLIALGTGSAVLFFVGTAVSGIGFGGGFQGSIRTVVPFAAPHERAGVMSLLYVVSYLGMGVPTVIAGFLAVHGAGLIGAARYYDVALVVLAAAALAALYRSRRQATVTA
ncbi:MAG TPA: MFS transporter [Trebonia sp.]|jgi:MFS family permease